MKKITRMLAASVALFIALLAVNGFTPNPALCQDDEEDEQECEFGDIWAEERDDGSTWVCISEIDCGDFTAKKLCRKW